MAPRRPTPAAATATASAAAVDPTIGWTPPRRPGRPARTSRSELIDAAIAIGLDRFTLAEVAERVGVGESTVYNHVVSRSRLFTAASAAVFEQLDVDVDASSWIDFVDVISQRCVDLAANHPGLRDYVLLGPYEASTISIFEALIDQVRSWLPDVDEHVAFVITSRPVVASLGYLGDPVLETSSPWLRRALLQGLDAAVRAGERPPIPAASWRTKLRPPD